MWDLERDPGLGPALARSRRRRARGIPPRCVRATRACRVRSSRLGRVLLHHRLRCGRHARRSRPQLPGLGRTARRHRPSVTAGADRRSRRRLALRRHRDPGRSARTRAHGPRYAPHRLDDAQRALTRSASAARQARSARSPAGSRATARTRPPDAAFTVTPVEPKFWQRLCELIERPDLVDRHYEQDQEALAAELAEVFRARPLAAGSSSSRARTSWSAPSRPSQRHPNGSARPSTQAEAPLLGEHTERWRADPPVRGITSSQTRDDLRLDDPRRVLCPARSLSVRQRWSVAPAAMRSRSTPWRRPPARRRRRTASRFDFHASITAGTAGPSPSTGTGSSTASTSPAG